MACKEAPSFKNKFSTEATFFFLICDLKKSIVKASEEGCIQITIVYAGEVPLCLVTEGAEASSSLSRAKVGICRKENNLKGLCWQERFSPVFHHLLFIDSVFTLHSLIVSVLIPSKKNHTRFVCRYLNKG